MNRRAGWEHKAKAIKYFEQQQHNNHHHQHHRHQRIHTSANTTTFQPSVARRTSTTSTHSSPGRRARSSPVMEDGNDPTDGRRPSSSPSSPVNPLAASSTTTTPNKELLEQANFEVTALSKQCQAQQQLIDALFSDIQLLQQEDENRVNEVRNSINNLKNMTRKYNEDVSKKFHSQQDSHYKRSKRMETSTLKNIKNLHDKLYKSHSTYVAQQTIFIQENIDQTSGKQRRLIISLTAKGGHWLAMGAMTIVGPCFKLLRCCGVRKTKLSDFAKDYLGTDQDFFEEPEE